MHRHFISFSVSSSPLISIRSFFVLADSRVVRDVNMKHEERQNQTLGKQKGPWINQGEHRMQPGMDFGREGRKEGQGWVWDRVRCNRRSWAGLVGKVEEGPGGWLMVSELSPQLQQRHWEMTGEDTDLKEGQQGHQSRKRGHPLLCVSGD